MATTIEHYRGDSGAVTCHVEDAAAANYDLSAATKATLSVKKLETDTTYQFQVSATIPITPGTDGNVTFNLEPYHTDAISAPTGMALAEDSGTLAAGDYYYRVSAVNWRGETAPCAEDTIAADPDTGVKITWNAVDGSTYYKIYGRAAGAELLMATVPADLLEWIDNGSVTPSGAMPVANTTGMTPDEYYYDVEIQWASGATIYTACKGTFDLLYDITRP